jgi:ABC-type polysaccharide/polyol phosphate export permease
MGDYLQSIWRCRYFWMSLVRMDLRQRYRRSVLGMGWSLLHPIAMTIILCTMFSQLFKVDAREYGPFLMAGLVCWQFVLGVTIQGCQSLLQGEAYIRQYPAPMAIYPLRTTLGMAVHFLIALAVVLLGAWYLHGLSNPLALVSLVPTLVLLFIFGWSLAVLAGFANVYFQDTQHLVDVAFQLLFYATPIMYSEKMLGDRHLGWLVSCNPVVPFLRLLREPILEGQVPSVATYAVAITFVIGAAGCATLTLARLQRQLIFHL